MNCVISVISLRFRNLYCFMYAGYTALFIAQPLNLRETRPDNDSAVSFQAMLLFHWILLLLTGHQVAWLD